MDEIRSIIERLQRQNEENERTKQERLEYWERTKGEIREWRERIRRDFRDYEAWDNDNWARKYFGGLYTAEFYGHPYTAKVQGEEDPTKRSSPRASRQQKERATNKKGSQKNHGPGGVYHPPTPHRRPDFAWIDGPIWPNRQLLSQLHQSWSPWYSSLDTGSQGLNGLLLAGALVLLVYYRRGVRSVLTTSAQLLYVTLWLVAVLVSEAERLLVDAFSLVFGFIAGLLYRVARDYVVLPTARWLGRTFRDMVYGVAAAVLVSWFVYATWLVLRWMAFVCLTGATALVGGGWALQTYVVGPLARLMGDRVRPQVYWVAVAVFAIWAAYGTMWMASLWWCFSPASPNSGTLPLSFMEMAGLEPELDLGHVVVRTVRDALGVHVDERLFTFSDAGRWEKRFMDWFVDRGYVLRPCRYPNCIIPDAEW